MSADRLPPELESLLAAERDVPRAPTEARARVLGRLESTIGLAPLSLSTPPPAGVSGTAAGGGLLKLTLVVVTASSIVVGAFLAASRGRHPVPIVAAPPPVVVAAAPAPAPPPGPAPVEAAHPAPPSVAAPPPLPKRAPSTLRDERALLDRARATLLEGDAQAALAALAEHGRRFAHGQLVEERDALVVLALVRAGRAEEARRRAEAFLARHPDSLQREIIDAAVTEAQKRPNQREGRHDGR